MSTAPSSSHSASAPTCRPRWSRRCLRLIASALVLLLAFAGAADARDKKKKKDTRQFTVSETVAKKLTKVQEAMAEEQWALATEELEGLEKKADRGRLQDHERALTYQFLSLIEAAQEHYTVAIAYMEKCLEQEALPEPAQLTMMYNVAQIHLALEEYPEAVSALKRWFRRTENRTSHAYYLLAVAYYQQSELEKALRPASKAVAIAKKPTQAWLQMLVGLYLHAERYEDAVPHVETLVSYFPKKSYYLQLSALYNTLGSEQDAFAVMQLAYDQGFLVLDRELRRLGEMYLYHGLPYRAALLMNQAIDDELVEADEKSLELLANSWIMAREMDRAVEPLIQAAELSEEGDLYVRLGQVYLEREQYASATNALAKGLERGVGKKEGNAQLLLGITYYNEKKPKSARRAFRAARKFDDSKEPALLWIQMLDREEKRAAQEAERAAEQAALNS